MPKLCNYTFVHVAEDGKRHFFDSEIHVNTDGSFWATVPADLVPALEGLQKPPARSASKMKINWRACAPSKNDLLAYVQAAMKEHYAVEVQEELVICYSWISEAAYWVRPDGSLCENGNAPGAAGGQWASDTRLHATNCVPHFSVGLFAAPYIKRTFTRASSKSVTYQRCLHGSGLGKGDGWAARLSGFCALSPKIDPQHMAQMPLTEEAAKFFFDSMLSLCEVSRRFTQFFSSTDNVERAIAGTGPNLLAHQPKES